jgi:hypothetical protein
MWLEWESSSCTRWHLSCYSYKPSEKSWTRKVSDSDYAKRITCDTDS